MRSTRALVVLSLVLLASPWARADGGLEIEASVGTAEAVSGEPIEFVATFRNTGTTPVSVYLPEFFDHNAFPHWTLTTPEGTSYKPHNPSFQSMWTQGLQGEIMTLVPGAERRFTTRRAQFVLSIPHMEDDMPRALPPGTYEVAARYQKDDTRVVHGREAFQSERVEHEGLWTGTVRSNAVDLLVRPSEKPALEILAPSRVTVGDPFRMQVTLRNPGPEPFSVNGAFVVRIASKAWGSASYRAVLAGSLVDARPDQTHLVDLDPGGFKTFELDLAEKTLWQRERAVGLYEVVPQGTFHLSVSYVAKDADASSEPVAAAGMFRAVEAPVPMAVSSDGLALRLETSKVHRGMGPTFEVVLRNDGPEPVRVPATLSYPRNVFFSFKPAGTDGPTGYAIEGRAPGEVMPLTYPDEPGILAQLPRGSRWDAEAFEPRAEGLDHTTTLLAPGGELRRRFYLPDLVAGEGQMSHGRWELRAYWRNRESGKRLGIEPEMPTVVLSASPIEVGGRGW